MHAHALLLLSLVTPLALSGQDETPVAQEQQEPEAWERVLDAFKDLRKRPIGFTGSVTREKPARNQNNFFFGGPDFGGNVGEPFVGGYSGFRYGDDEFCVTSDKAFPGFTAWLGEQLIVSTLGSRKVTDVAGAMETIGLLLDSRRIARASDEVEWKAEPGPNGEGHVIQGVLPPSILEVERPEAQSDDMAVGLIVDFGGPSNEPLRVDTTLTLDAKGSLVEMRFAVVHNDGDAAMQIAFEEAEDGNGVFDFEPEQGFEPVDGEVVTWTFRLAGEAPSEKLAQFRAQALELLKTAEF